MHDVIVVGARCAGAATAMLMAREGLDVVVVDRATFPSDTRSTHAITRSGVVLLKRWGIYDDVLATGVEPVRSFRFVVNGVVDATLPIGPADTIGDATVAPRRIAFDDVLVRRARAAGAEVREGFTFTDVTRDSDGCVTGVTGRDADGNDVELRAKLVVGADGYRSSVARAVGAAEHRRVEPVGCAFYSYFSGHGATTNEFWFDEGRAVLLFITNHGQACVGAAWPIAEWDVFRKDPEAGFWSTIARFPDLSARLKSGTREERFHGGNDIPNVFRDAHGPGWALVGDAGYCKDPMTGHGMTDALRDAELVADAAVAGLRGGTPMADALAAFQARRDALSAEIYAVTVELGRVTWSLPECIRLWTRFAALVDEEADEFASWPARGPVPA